MNTATKKLFSSLILIALVCAGCSSTLGEKTKLKRLYDKSAQYHLPDRNPVIVIPGILGSRLTEEITGQVVWGGFRRDFADPNTDKGARLISLPLTGNPTTDEWITTDVFPDGVLDNIEVKLAGFPFTIQAYANILYTLGVGGYRDETLGLNAIDYGTDHFTCFQFAYDWRQDIAYNAALLRDFIDEKREEVQKHYAKEYGLENADVKFDIVAHSMGSLLARYFARYGDAVLTPDTPITWEGATDLARVILVAPPNAGTVEAIEQLVNGFNTGRPVLPHYHPAMIGTFPSVYQLLPRSRHQAVVWDGDLTNPVENILDPALWEKMQWGLSAQDDKTKAVLQTLLPEVESQEERHTIARAFQRNALERAKIFQEAMDQPAKPPQGLEMFLVAGDGHTTPEVVSIDTDTGGFSIAKFGLGDETVLRTSALMDERMGQEWAPVLVSPITWSATLFTPGKHRSITNGPIFEDNVLYWLLEDPRENSLAETEEISNF